MTLAWKRTQVARPLTAELRQLCMSFNYAILQGDEDRFFELLPYIELHNLINYTDALVNQVWSLTRVFGC